MKSKIAALLLLFISLPLMSQPKKSFTLDDLLWGGSNYWNLQPKHYFAAWWGDRLVSLDVDDASLVSDAAGRKVYPKNLFSADAVNAALDTARCGKVRNLAYAQFPEAKKPLALLRADSAAVLYDWKQGKVVWTQHRPAGVQAGKFHYASRRYAYVQGDNLFVENANGEAARLTADGSRDVVYGQSVHRNEFGIHEGLFWSPDGGRLAFYRMDQSMVTDFPLVDISPRIAQLAPEKYPMAGMTSHKVSVGVYDVATGKTVYLQTGDPTDRYFTNVAWSPDGRSVYLFELPRTQDKAELVVYDAATGQRKGVIYTETNAKYVEPMHPIVFLPWDDSRFVMQSRRDGWNHLYLCSADGKMIEQLTRGAYEVTDMLGFNEKTHSIIYRSNQTSPLNYNHWSVKAEGGAPALLDNGTGSHSADLSASGAFLLDRWSKSDVFRHIDIVGTAPKAAKVSVANLMKYDSPWADYNVPEIKNGTLLAADGKTPLYYRLVLPVDFDTSKKYPAVVYVYGGPHAHLVENCWNYMARPWEIYMAQRGYVVFVLDNRGSENRGFAFESCTHRHLGEVEMADQMEGVKLLRSLPYVDSTRLGVHGWSFGGFMTTNLLCSYPDVFKVGVAGGPVIDWKYYEVMYGERYMDTPQENPDGYSASSLLNKAKNLKGGVCRSSWAITTRPACCSTASPSCVLAKMRGHSPTTSFTLDRITI